MRTGWVHRIILLAARIWLKAEDPGAAFGPVISRHATAAELKEKQPRPLMLLSITVKLLGISGPNHSVSLRPSREQRLQIKCIIFIIVVVGDTHAHSEKDGEGFCSTLLPHQVSAAVCGQLYRPLTMAEASLVVSYAFILKSEHLFLV